MTRANKTPLRVIRVRTIMNDTPHNLDAARHQTAIGLDDVHLTLEGPAGQVNILRGVSLTVPQGEALGVVGPSGSGKTTMLMVTAGLERITSGTVSVAGQDYAALDEDGLALFRRDNIGIVFQSFHLITTMSALENVAVPLEFAGRTDAFELAEEQLEAVGLAHRMGHYPGQLSGGEQQRVALARAFAVKPKLLLADEPTGNLDPDTAWDIMQLLGKINQRKTTIIVATHDWRIVNKMRRRVVRLMNGNVVSDTIMGHYA